MVKRERKSSRIGQQYFSAFFLSFPWLSYFNCFFFIFLITAVTLHTQISFFFHNTNNEISVIFNREKNVHHTQQRRLHRWNNNLSIVSRSITSAASHGNATPTSTSLRDPPPIAAQKSLATTYNCTPKTEPRCSLLSAPTTPLTTPTPAVPCSTATRG